MSGGESGLRPRKRPAVVLDARTIADFLKHLDVEPRSRAEAMGLQQLALVLEQFEPLFQFLLDVGHRRLRCVPRAARNASRGK